MISKYLLFSFVPTTRIIIASSNYASTSAYSSVTQSANFFSSKNKERIIEYIQRANAKEGKSPPNVDEFAGQTAVLVPIIDHDGVASILFTVRANHLSTHRGEVCFPGGAADAIDGGLAEKTALREAEEEIGVDPKTIDIWGHLPPIWARKRDKIVRPVIGVLRDGFDIVAFNKRNHENAEVVHVFVRSLDTLASRKHLLFTQFRAGYSLPVFTCGRYRIWGMTAIILHRAMKVLVPDLYSPTVRYLRPVK